MGKNKALIPTNSVKRINSVENADQRRESFCFGCGSAHGKLGLVAGLVVGLIATRKYVLPLTVTSAGDL
jgi:hypothetical protein